MRWNAELYVENRAIGAAQGPDQEFQPFGKMQKRRGRWERDVGGIGDCVAFEFPFCVLQWPGQMVNLAAVDVVLVRRVEAETRGEEVFDCSFLADADRTDGAIQAAEFSRCIMPLRGVKDEVFTLRGFHGRMEIWQMVDGARGPNCQQIT